PARPRQARRNHLARCGGPRRALVSARDADRSHRYLDPLATGVLVLCLGSATRLTEYVQRMSKTYRAGIRLGARSDSDDADGAVTPVLGAVPPDDEAIMQSVASFTGTIEQVPPAFSAAKVAGRRAYDLARGGKDVVLRPRSVQIYRIEVLSYSWPD